MDEEHQLDIVTLYHAIVDSNSESLQTDMLIAFEKFKAYLYETKIEKCDIQSRFFNALSQLEFIGAIVMASDDSFKLLYLPTSVALKATLDD